MVTIIPQIYIRGNRQQQCQQRLRPGCHDASSMVLHRAAVRAAHGFHRVDRIEVLRGPQGRCTGVTPLAERSISSQEASDRLRGPVRADRRQLWLEAGASLYQWRDQSRHAASQPVGNYLSHSGYVQNIAPGVRASELPTAAVCVPRCVSRRSNRSRRSRASIGRKSNERPDSFDHTLAPLNGANLANSIIGDYRRAAIDAPQEAHSEFSGVAQEVN